MIATLSVLIVDDSEDLRDLLSMVIERHPAGWRVVATAAEGEEAIEEARSSQPDLVLLDIAMPVMDGMQALPHPRSSPGRRRGDAVRLPDLDGRPRGPRARAPTATSRSPTS